MISFIQRPLRGQKGRRGSKPPWLSKICTASTPGGNLHLQIGGDGRGQFFHQPAKEVRDRSETTPGRGCILGTLPPSSMKVASVQGEPAKPMSAVLVAQFGPQQLAGRR